MTLCTRWLSVVAVFAASAFAQTPPPGNPNDWSAPPMTGAPVAKPAPVANPDAVAVGIQFHGEVSGGTSGFGGAASFGIGFNRVAILFTPTLSLAANNVSLFITTLDLSVRIYLRQRTANALVAYLRPGAGVLFGVAVGGGAGSSFGGGFNFGAGAEYLLTKNLGFTIELALRVTALTVGSVTSTPVGLNTVGSVGIMLHQ